VILVVGLGNPGARYAEHRHNVGFKVVDRLAERAGNPPWRAKFNGEFAQAELAGQRLGLLKPQTYMNRSGQSVRAAATFFKLAPADVLVVHDELDLPFGDVRLKLGGGEAGHNGVRSVTQELSSPDYARLRIGIGRPPPDFRGSGADFVLEAFAPLERADLDDVIGRSADAVALVVERGLQMAMNATNQRKKR
jgi:peptidyl-tRNA hydrolase, PTH1 family